MRERKEREMKPMSQQAARQYRELAKDKAKGIRDLYYFVADLKKRPLLFVNAWGDNLEVGINDPWNHARTETGTTIPYGSTLRDIREMALEEASWYFGLERSEICLVSMNGRVLCR